jgi:hypothetical protein
LRARRAPRENEIRTPPDCFAACGHASADGRIPPLISWMFTRTRTDRTKRFASATLASLLLAGLLASLFPLETLATGQMCNLACCAGRAPHAAGSCMDGSCYAALKKHSTHNRSFQRRQVAEQFCGLSRFARKPASRKSDQAVEVSSTKNESESTRLSSSTISKPCLPNCGSCGSGSAATDFRNHAVMARRQQSRPLAATGLSDVSSAVSLTIKTLLRQSAPRAPPITFS